MTLERASVGWIEPSLSWSSIIGGALVAVATSVFLGLLAAGFGLDLSVSGVASHSSLAAFTPVVGAIAVAIQVVAAAFGGYVAGRLRHVWTQAHADEMHFRDTAHGLIAWALATVIGVLLTVLVMVPYAESLAAPPPPPSPADIERAGHLAAQSAFFGAFGMILAAFTAAVAARLGGLQAEHMHARHLA
jgi:CDP-diglyceride synthetase